MPKRTPDYRWVRQTLGDAHAQYLRVGLFDLDDHALHLMFFEGTQPEQLKRYGQILRDHAEREGVAVKQVVWHRAGRASLAGTKP